MIATSYARFAKAQDGMPRQGGVRGVSHTRRVRQRISKQRSQPVAVVISASLLPSCFPNLQLLLTDLFGALAA